MEFTPSVYEHAARLIGRTPWEVSRDPELLYAGHAAAFRQYGHRPVVVGIDIYNLEAEAYGATIAPPAGNGIPAITQHPLAGVDQIAALPPLRTAADGRLAMVIDVGRRLQAAFPAADVRVPVSGPFSIASNLVGFDALLIAVVESPAATAAALLHLAQGQEDFCRQIVRAGLDVAFFESAATPPLLSPERFATVELPALRQMMDVAAAAAGHPVPCIIGGDTAPILDAMLSTGSGYLICPCETDQEAFMGRMRAHPHVMVRVNTRADVYAAGAVADMERELDRVLALIGDREQACVGSGALPFEADPDRVLRAREYVAAARRAGPGC